MRKDLKAPETYPKKQQLSGGLEFTKTKREYSSKIMDFDLSQNENQIALIN